MILLVSSLYYIYVIYSNKFVIRNEDIEKQIIHMFNFLFFSEHTCSQNFGQASPRPTSFNTHEYSGDVFAFCIAAPAWGHTSHQDLTSWVVWSGPKLCNKNFTGSLSHFVPHFWAKPFCRLYIYIYIILYSTQIWSVINPLIILSIVQISTGAKTLIPYRLQHLSSRQYSYVFFPTALLTM